MPETLPNTPTAGPAAPGLPAVPRSGVLTARLDALRTRFLWVETGKGVALAIIVCLELLALFMFLDWLIDFPWSVRLVLFFLQFGIFNYLLYRFVFHPRFRPPDDEELALQVERAFPELRSRLISSIQFAKPGALSPGASVGLAHSTVEQTEAATAALDFPSIISTETLQRLGIIAGLVLLFGTSGFLASRVVSVDLLRRAFLSDVAVPRKTRIDWVTGDITVGRGDALRLEAVASGIIPERGQVRLRQADKPEQSFDLERDSAQHSRFVRLLDNVQEDFGYRLRINDAVSPDYTVRVVPRPSVNQLECEQIPPAYTGLKPGRRSPGDLTVLAGSKLRFSALATQPLRSAALRLVGLQSTQALVLSAERPLELKGEIQIPRKGLSGFAFDLLDTVGMRSKEGTVYRVDILPDKTPVTKLTWPERKEELITRLATLVIGLDVSDDFGLARLALKYRITSVEGGAEQQVELNLEATPVKAAKRRFHWKIGDFQPPLVEGSIIEYWIEAQDNNDVTGPGIGTSEHQVARVVSDNEKRADLLNRAGDSIGVLGDVTADQEKLNRTLGTLILEKTGAR